MWSWNMNSGPTEQRALKQGDLIQDKCGITDWRVIDNVKLTIYMKK